MEDRGEERKCVTKPAGPRREGQPEAARAPLPSPPAVASFLGFEEHHQVAQSREDTAGRSERTLTPTLGVNPDPSRRVSPSAFAFSEGDEAFLTLPQALGRSGRRVERVKNTTLFFALNVSLSATSPENRGNGLMTFSDNGP